MGIDRNLLTKAAKVYEATEAVEGMKPKEVYESHKKCAPGEFGMNKEGYAKLQRAIKHAVDSTASPAAPMATRLPIFTGLKGIGSGQQYPDSRREPNPAAPMATRLPPFRGIKVWGGQQR